MRSLVAGAPRSGAPEVVVVPGLGALGYLLPAVRACATRTRVHLLDVPGFGDPRTADLPSALPDVVAVVRAWLREVPTRPVLLVGHSTGAQAALAAAVDVPVRALVLAGVTFPPAARTPGRLAARVARTLVHERPRELAAVLPEYRRGGRRLLALLGSALADRPEDAVAGVDAPVVVVRGRADRLCDGAWARTLADRARTGRVVELPGAHNTPTTHPGPTADAWLGAGS